MPNYKIGSGHPPFNPDPGAGPWGSKTPTPEMILAKVAILQNIGYAWLVYDDAAKHLRHFFGNTGRDYIIDFQGMLDDVPKVKAAAEKELEEAMDFAKSLPPGVTQITSSSLKGIYIHKSDSPNWFYANGGIFLWGEGTVTVADNGSTRSVHLALDVHMWDRYNWDGGKKTTIGPFTITDESMAEFHRMGLAREFDCFGKAAFVKSLNVAAPSPAPPPPGPPQPGPAKQRIHVVRPGDSLSKIAQQYYGNMSKWPTIYAANQAVVGPNPNLIHPGQKLIIP